MIKKILCYSRFEFDDILESVWYHKIPENVGIISIVSPNDPVPDFPLMPADNVVCVSFDDCDPMTFSQDKNISDEKFNFSYYSEQLRRRINIHCMDYDDAGVIVKKLENWNKDDKIDTIIVHCSAGASRSQGVVRYVLDVYNQENHQIETRKSNPCTTPNMFVVMMLKRVYMKNYIV